MHIYFDHARKTKSLACRVACISFLIGFCVSSPTLGQENAAPASMEAAEKSLQGILEGEMAMRGVVVGMDDTRVAVSANPEDDPTLIEGQLLSMVVMAGKSAPWTKTILASLHLEGAPLAYATVPTDVFRKARSGEATQEEFIAACQITILSPADYEPDDPDDPPIDPDDPPGDPDDPPGDPDDPPGDPDDPPGNPNRPTGPLRIRAEDREVRPNVTVTVPVRLEALEASSRTRTSRPNIANLNFEIRYDPSVVKPAGDVIAGNLLGSAIFQANTTEAGVIKIGFATKQGIQLGGILAQIPFLAVGQAGQRTALEVTITTVNNEQGGTPAVTSRDGSIKILATGVPGDINGNGVVDAGDALCALKMSVDLMTEDLILNVDNQNGVTSNDARLLLKMAVQGSNTVPNAGGGTNAGGGQNVGPSSIRTPKTAEGKRAYQEYIAAYNRLTSLKAKGKGDTPEAEAAHKAYVAALKKYEASLDPPPGNE